jgi:hypothetical protein
MLTWHCQAKTLANLNSQVQHLQGDIDYSIPYLQQQILHLNNVGELVVRTLETPRRRGGLPDADSLDGHSIDSPTNTTCCQTYPCFHIQIVKRRTVEVVQTTRADTAERQHDRRR